MHKTANAARILFLCAALILGAVAHASAANTAPQRTKQKVTYRKPAAAKKKAPSGREPIPVVSQSPYAAALLMDAKSGRVLFADNPDKRLYPASLVKLMTMLVVIEAVEARQVALNDTVTVCAEAEKTDGSKVNLRQNEQFSVDELLYALMLQSANDAAVALARHVAGSTAVFVERMNKRARMLGMTSSEYHSVNGLPPAKNQKPDYTTPRDIAKLSREVLRHKEALRYTSETERTFRNDSFVMRNHNPLLKSVDGCDGLKTGYYRAAGFSIAATANRNGVRALAIVMGSKDRLVRNSEAERLLLLGLDELEKSSPYTVSSASSPSVPQVAASGASALQ